MASLFLNKLWSWFKKKASEGLHFCVKLEIHGIKCPLKDVLSTEVHASGKTLSLLMSNTKEPNRASTDLHSEECHLLDVKYNDTIIITFQLSTDNPSPILRQHMN